VIGVLKKPVPVPGTGIDLPPVPVSVFSGIYTGILKSGSRRYSVFFLIFKIQA
jgi:hypothetical protein